MKRYTKMICFSVTPKQFGKLYTLAHEASAEGSVVTVSEMIRRGVDLLPSPSKSATSFPDPLLRQAHERREADRAQAASEGYDTLEIDDRN